MRKKIKQKVWKFESLSSDKTYTTIKFTDGTFSCDCPGFTRRKGPASQRECTHIAMVLRGSADKKALIFTDFTKTNRNKVKRIKVAHDRYGDGGGQIRYELTNHLRVSEGSYTRATLAVNADNRCVGGWRGTLMLVLFEGKDHKDKRINIKMDAKNYNFPAIYKHMLNLINNHINRIDKEMGRTTQVNYVKPMKLKPPPSFPEFHAYAYGFGNAIEAGKKNIERSKHKPCTVEHNYQCPKAHLFAQKKREYIIAYGLPVSQVIEIGKARGHSAMEAFGLLMSRKHNFKIVLDENIPTEG